MKKIDRLLLVSFIGPFLVTFGIATFVLLMQILWVYIDDIAGKGLSVFVIMELLAYKCVGLVPMALPLAILISAVMVMGGLAERYELSSLKSAGISLLRVMRPIIVFGSIATFVSYLCNDYIIPVANLQFGSRMYDIREKKPTMSMETGVFNDDFGNYAIRIGEKGSDGRTISDILIYDHSEANSGKLTQVVAESGEMFSTKDGSYFVMQLYNGHQYIESRPTGRNTGKGAPFIRTAFKSWNKVFDLSEFNMDITNPDLFSQNRSMMSISQLASQIDTIQKRIDQRYLNLAKQVGTHFSVLPVDSLYPQAQLEPEEDELSEIDAEQDSLANEDTMQDSLLADSLRLLEKMGTDSIQRLESYSQRMSNAGRNRTDEREKLIALEKTTDQKERMAKAAAIKKAAGMETKVDSSKVQPQVPLERFDDTITSVTAWLEILTPAERRRFMTKAKSSARAIINQAEQAEVSLSRTKEDKVKHIYEMHTKYSMAVVCIIFVFIGAPLGAIVRKGGFGYPLLVSVVAFIVFIVLTIFCRKIAETLLVPASLAAWLPCIILSPIGVWLTIKAMADSKLFDLSGLTASVSKLFRMLRPEKKQPV
ncbi:LptF/LptG family permease [Lewinella cohaerens]|uniref:LptF/LptG family permease n=1 Tax=Lewinella cohaerens TaxID=70995 RepID=UPI00035F82EC|nr:LptF/LptG family permease [Lewinella cohaerens]